MNSISRTTLQCLTALALLLAMSACGYQLAGTGTAQLPSHIKTISIPLFDNKSGEPTIQRTLTNAVRNAFITDGRLKVVEPEGADLVMNGVLTSYSIRAVSFDTNDVATQYWVYLYVDVDVQDLAKDSTYVKQSLKTRWDYRPGNDVVNAEAARQEAFDQAYRDLSIRLVSLLIDKF